MDFAKFLNTGELSDIVVLVDGTEFKLHKFPLFIKSDFFRALARSALPEKDRITLTDFPGGPDTFRLVASYCYNVHIDVTVQNVCQLRCAAEFLQMSGPTNLAGLTDRFLQDTLSSARVRRRLDVIVQLIARCKQLGAIAEQSNIVDKCLLAVIDCWLLPAKYSRRLTSDRLGLGPEADSAVNSLCRVPLVWFARLLKTSREKSVSPALLTSLVQRYVDRAVDRNAGRTTQQQRRPELPSDAEHCRVEPEKPEREKEERAMRGDGEESREDGRDEDEQEEVDVEVEGEEDGDGGEEDEDEEEGESEGEGSELGEESPRSPEMESPRKELEQKPLSCRPPNTHKQGRDVISDVIDDVDDDAGDDDGALSDAELCNVLDTILGQIPSTDYQTVADCLQTSWIIGMLLLCDKLGCVKSRDVMLKLVSCAVDRLSTDELSQLAPDTFVRVIQTAGPEEMPGRPIDPTKVCHAVDLYLQSVSERGDLTADMYRRIVEAVPEKCRTNDDSFFNALRGLLTSDKVSAMETSERQSLLDSIDYGRLSESALQSAYETKLIPVGFIAKAALDLCTKLRAELDQTKQLVRTQEVDLAERRGRGIGTVGVASGLTGSVWTGSRPGDVTDSGSYRYRHIASSASKSPKSMLHYPSTGTGTAALSAYRTGTGSSTACYDVTSGSSSGGMTSSYRNVPSLASQLELQLALDTLDAGGDSSVSRYHGNDDVYRSRGINGSARPGTSGTYSSAFTSRSWLS